MKKRHEGEIFCFLESEKGGPLPAVDWPLERWIFSLRGGTLDVSLKGGPLRKE